MADHALADRTRRICKTCGTVSPQDFQLQPAADSPCQHAVDACDGCWEQWIDAQLNSRSPSELSCISEKCSTVLRQEDVRAYASPKLYQRYLDLSLQAALADANDFEHCIVPGCDSGQLHDGGIIFCCVKCEAKHCVSCKVLWHEDKTCEEVQAEMKVNEEEALASEQIMENTTKKCPGCQARIEKNGGCEHMTCKKCRHEFCWLCLIDYNNIRNIGMHGHQETCPHYRAPAYQGRPPPPQDQDPGLTAQFHRREAQEAEATVARMLQEHREHLQATPWRDRARVYANQYGRMREARLHAQESAEFAEYWERMAAEQQERQLRGEHGVAVQAAGNYVNTALDVNHAGERLARYTFEGPIVFTPLRALVAQAVPPHRRARAAEQAQRQADREEADTYSDARAAERAQRQADREEADTFDEILRERQAAREAETALPDALPLHPQIGVPGDVDGIRPARTFERRPSLPASIEASRQIAMETGIDASRTALRDREAARQAHAAFLRGRYAARRAQAARTMQLSLPPEIAPRSGAPEDDDEDITAALREWEVVDWDGNT